MYGLNKLIHFIHTGHVQVILFLDVKIDAILKLQCGWTTEISSVKTLKAPIQSAFSRSYFSLTNQCLFSRDKIRRELLQFTLKNQRRKIDSQPLSFKRSQPCSDDLRGGHVGAINQLF